MILDHHDAVLDLLSGLQATVYDGQVPDTPTLPYAVVYMDTSHETATRLCATSDRAEFRFQVTSVGATTDSALITADAARAAVLDQRPAVSGRVCGPIRHETSIPVRPDRDVTLPEFNRHPMFAVDTYVFTSYAN